MATLQNIHDPQWTIFPVNNDRTAWKPFGLPILLVVPHRRDPGGIPMANSAVDCIKVYIENVPQADLVAGQDHIIQVQPTDACDQPLVTLTQWTNGIITNTQTDCSNETALLWFKSNSYVYNTQSGHWVNPQQPFLWYTVTPSSTYFTQLRFPDRELYAVIINAFQLADMQIIMSATEYWSLTPPSTGGYTTIVDQLSGNTYYSIDRFQAAAGDYIRYTTNSGVTDFVPYLPDADYFDFSGITIAVEPLPADHYMLVYQCEYFTRDVTTVGTGELLCINPNSLSLAIFRFPFNHPGELIGEFYRLTPAPYLTTTNKAADTTIEIYRPFTDALQDIHDEQNLLESINWVYDVPDTLIPYLSTLLGWDFPYLPDEFEGLRRVLLRNTSWLQTIKGSRLAVTELFRLLGIEILINNLWWSSDGLVFITPGENPDYAYTNQRINILAVTQIEPLLGNYQISGFGNSDGSGNLQVPLLYRPQIVGGLDNFNAPTDGGDVYISTFLVDINSAAYTLLLELLEGNSACTGAAVDPIAFSQQYQPNSPQYIIGQDHTYQDSYITKLLLTYFLDQDGDVHLVPKIDGVGGFSQVRLVQNIQPNVASGPLGIAISQATYTGWALPPIIQTGLQFDRTNNVIGLTFNGYIDFTGASDLPGPRHQRAVFSFACYTRQQLVVPAAIQDLQSNRFDIQLLQVDSVPPLAGMLTYTDPQLLDFALEFLNKIKAFHSLLNTVHLVLELNETYETGDICVGGDIQQRYDTMMGQLQVPYAIIPRIPGEDCDQLDPLALGYKQADIIYRLRKLANLPEEFTTWQTLDQPHTNWCYTPWALGGLWYQCGTTSKRTDNYSTEIVRITAAPAANRTGKYNPQGQDRVVYRPRPTLEIYDSQGARKYQIEGLLKTQEYGPSPNAGQLTVNSDAGMDPSPSQIVVNSLFEPSGALASTNNNSSIYGSFTRQYDDPTIDEPLNVLDGITDYCYKGRAHDEILYRQALVKAEIYRNRIFGLSLGTGVYWTYSALSLDWIAGTAQPAMGSSTGKYYLTGNARTAYILNYKNMDTIDGIRQSPYLNAPYDQPISIAQDTFLGKLLQAYGNPTTQSLHYTNTIQPAEFLQTRALSLLRPSIDLKLETLHFPGCRFLSLIGLLEDFTHDTWLAKPWDDPYSTACGLRGYGPEPTWLHATLVPDPFGDEMLVYDMAPYQIVGDGLTPDIPTLIDHSGAALASSAVVHNVYSTASVGYCDPVTGEPAITMEQVYYAWEDATTPGIDWSNGTIAVTNPLFDSHAECVDKYLQHSMRDYIDGYPAQTGIQPYATDLQDRNGVSFEPMPATALFFLGDGILVTTGYRLDSYNGTLGCDGTWQSPNSNIGMYMDDANCGIDPNEDRVQFIPAVMLNELYGGAAKLLDGSIPSLFELVPQCPTGTEILAQLDGEYTMRCYDPVMQTS